jgi:hypothetical protein
MITSFFTLTTAELIEFLSSAVVSLILGAVIAAFHTYKNTYSKNFIITLAILPVIVQAVIMVVNGNIGTGVAVMGAFSLVRFRSVPGNSREIASVFLAMAAGLAAGTGELSLAILLTIVVEAMVILMVRFTGGSGSMASRILRVTIPENLDYQDIFDDVFSEYTSYSKLNRVKTVNMGSLYELNYDITLKDEKKEKSMLDDIRMRNGNLTVVCGRVPDGRKEEL